MEEVIGFLASINKISIVAFIITMGFLVYEFRLIRREKISQTKPSIPRFDAGHPGGEGRFQSATVVDRSKKVDINFQSQRWLFSILFLMAIFFAGVTVIGFVARTDSGNTNPPVTVVYHEVASGGVKIYTPDWKEIGKDQLNAVQPGSEIIIGVESIPDADIDRARIRVNSSQWSADNITVKYDKGRNIYYRSYQLASNTAQLTIEAQLHSVKDGWLGD
ncbi:hypothetical protein M1523_00925 [Patescibacteria group bacterium]|nr:hypothetical protein [Patescibacteria group bacterium]MCL5091720.1 hypothetical protein [Patescibacteria group bacterium]